MTPVLRQIVFINTAHTITHYSLAILPTAVLAMAVPGGPFGESYGPILALATGMFVLYGLLSLPQGWLAQCLGHKILMTAFFLGIAAGLIGAGLAHSPTMLAIALAFAGGFAAIYHPIGTTMLIEAAGDKPGSSIGVNGVFGNLGVALAPVITAFLAHAVGWRAAFIAPGLFCVAVGLLWMRTPLVPAHLHHVNRRPFPPIPRHLVRRAVLVLMLIAMTSGLVFNAFTLLLPKLLQERLAGNPSLLPLIGLAAFVVTLCGALTQFSVGRMIDRNTLKRVFLPVSIVLAPAMLALSFAQGWLVLPLAAAVAASVFGQVTVNDTTTARYISPELRARIYSVRFFVGFLGSAAAAPVVSIFYERTGVAAVTMVLAVFCVVTLGCALFFPNRKEELEPELWADALPAAAE
jgi:MFS family permease